MNLSPSFLRFTGACGIMAGIFTLALWSLPMIYGRPPTLEARLALHGDPLYMARLWLSFINVFFVLLMSWGLTLKKFRDAPGAASIGMLFMLIYGLAELLGRSTMIFVRENHWTARWLTEQDPASRESLLDSIRLFDQVFGGLYVLLLIGFVGAAFSFGLATRGGAGLERWVSRLLFAAAGLAVITLATRFFPWPPLRTTAMWAYPLIQPASRILIGLWLWRLVKNDGSPAERLHTG